MIYRLRNHGHVVVQQYDVCTRTGNVGSARHGNGYVGGGQNGCVVDAVSHHQHFLALPLQGFDIGQFVFRHGFSAECVQMQVLRQRLHGGLAVSAEEVEG